MPLSSGPAAAGTPRAARRLRRWLRRARPCTLAVLGALLASPALLFGTSLDDHWFRINLQGSGRFAPIVRAPWDLFSFYVDPDTTRFVRDQGIAPWWTDPDVLIRFFRPLPSLSHWLDFHVLGGSAFAQHAHSLAWYALLVGAAALFLRRTASSRLAATLGALVFALMAGHSAPATWISNRNALVSSCFAVLAIGLYCSALQRARRGPALLAAPCLLAALLGGEMALGAAGFIAAAELALARDSLARRAARVIPSLLAMTAWLLAYRRLGFGVRGSGLYVDPGAEPIAFARVLPERFAALFGASLSGLPAEAFSLAPVPAQPLVAGVLLMAALAVLWFCRRALCREPSARFFASALALAIVPTCSTMPAGRLMVLASVAGAGLLGEGLADALRFARTRSSRVAVGLVLLLHGPLAWFQLVGGGLALDAADGRLARASEPLNVPEVAAARCVVFFHAPMLVNGYLLAQREVRGLPSPRYTLNLAATDHPVAVRGLGGSSLAVEAPGGFYGPGDIGLLTRKLERPFALGERVSHPCGDLTVEALTPAGTPSRVRFDAADTASPAYAWVDGRLERVRWLREGETFERPGGVRF